MNSFLQRHTSAVMGQLASWDRLRFRGTLRMLANAAGMFGFLCYTGHLLKDFGALRPGAEPQGPGRLPRAGPGGGPSGGAPERPLGSLRSNWRRTWPGSRASPAGSSQSTPLSSPAGATTSKATDRAAPGAGPAYRKCQHLYHYQIHPVFGFMHARLQTWLPFNLTVNVNGREWLSRQMDAAGDRLPPGRQLLHRRRRPGRRAGAYGPAGRLRLRRRVGAAGRDGQPAAQGSIVAAMTSLTTGRWTRASGRPTSCSGRREDAGAAVPGPGPPGDRELRLAGR